LLRDRIVLGIRDASTQKLLLRERDLTLNKTIDICKATESAVTQEEVFRPETVNKLHSYKDTVSMDKAHKSVSSTNKSRRRKYCGTDHVFVKEKCPAWGKVCASCSKRNHFAKMCHQSKSQDFRSTNSRTKSHKPIHHVEEKSNSEVEWVNAIHKHEPNRKYDDLKCEMLVGDKTVAFQIDTGASINILPVNYAPYIHPTCKKLTMWNGNQFTPLGVRRTKLQNPKNNKRYNVEFVVVEGDRTPLIGLSAAEQMKLITVNDDKLNLVL